jgi:hypothetical protein
MGDRAVVVSAMPERCTRLPSTCTGTATASRSSSGAPRPGCAPAMPATPPHASSETVTRRLRALSIGVYGLGPKEMHDVASGRAGRIGHGDNGVWLVDVSTGELTQALEQSQHAAIAKYSTRGREDLVLIRRAPVMLSRKLG